MKPPMSVGDFVNTEGRHSAIQERVSAVEHFRIASRECSDASGAVEGIEGLGGESSEVGDGREGVEVLERAYSTGTGTATEREDEREDAEGVGEGDPYGADWSFGVSEKSVDGVVVRNLLGSAAEGEVEESTDERAEGEIPLEAAETVNDGGKS
tara:strand:+ start:233 stop:694 length:462 start_codon:yes stop_codon:yes gene_type:complete